MKRILIFSLAYYPSHVSGAEVAIKEITDRISPEAIEFVMITHRFLRTAPRRERIGAVEVHRVGFGPTYISKMFFVPLAAFKAVTLNRAKRFDASWVMMTYMLFPLVLAKLCGLRGPYILTLQDGDPYEKVFGRWFILPFASILNWGFRNATKVQAVSTYLATWPARRGYRYDVALIPNGASLESSAEYSAGDLEALREHLRIKEGQVLLLSIGRLVHQKAIDDVIRALALLPTHFRLVVAGDGPDIHALKALAEQLKVSKRVQWLGHVGRQETAKLRNICDIFVLPSRSEGQGISFLSTMAAGMPLVATQEGGLADFISPAVAWPVPKDAPERIAGAVQDIISDPGEATRRAERAKQLVHDNYEWDTLAARMKREVFEDVLKQVAK